ncbi:PQQ-binding-like beta-propeller repeat protein [Chloroflexi bacterium TSY]|nr:PQQ-binding-like beta-propeller repeat protein [Chloroflexi bacterium TSY]
MLITSSIFFAACSRPLQISDSGYWAIEGASPKRHRFIEETIDAPLTLQAEFVIDGDTQFTSPPTIANGILFADSARQLHALSLMDSRNSNNRQWQLNLPGFFLSPTVAGERVFVRAESGDDGYLYALSVDASAKLWEYKFPKVGSQYDNLGGHVTAPVVAGDLIFVGAAETLIAFDVDKGSEIWRYQTVDPIASSVSVAGDLLYLADFERVYALEVATGAERWQFEHGTLTLYFAPVVFGERVIVTSFDRVIALDRQNGKILWEKQFDEMSMIPAAASTRYAFAKSTNQLFALDIQDGRMAWSYGATNFVSLPVVTENQLYIVTRADGGSQLRALNLADGQEVWRTSDAEYSNAAPIASGNAVYVRTVDGRILAYTSNTQ